jgi:UDP-N-acetylmuramoylalanine--D-glutamate ligase
MDTCNLHVVVGLGVTGLSCVRYLLEKKYSVVVMDTRLNPPALAELQASYPRCNVILGKLEEAVLAQAKVIILSPGVALSTPAIAKQRDRGVHVIGDLDLFFLAAKAPVIGITGTNAKSTVTTLVGLMAKAAGVAVQVGGNLGVPVLDLLADSAQLYVLELSSFQLDTLNAGKLNIAALLNITPDHLDRYPSFADYQASKQRIFSDCDIAIYNRDDVLTYPQKTGFKQQYCFTLQTPRENEFGLIAKSEEEYLAFDKTLLLNIKSLPVRGRHYQANALAALAIGYSIGLPFAPMISALEQFSGLAHRCQLVRELSGVKWFNDSKGTNVGATLAAIEGLGPTLRDGKLILLAGGVGKGSDFSPLLSAVASYTRLVILIGEAACEIELALRGKVRCVHANSLEKAVLRAQQEAIPNDAVLLSPACASYDMFRNFEHRGDVFTALVSAL